MLLADLGSGSLGRYATWRKQIAEVFECRQSIGNQDIHHPARLAQHIQFVAPVEHQRCRIVARVPLPVAVDGAISRYRYAVVARSEEHTSELQSLMRISYAVFCLKKKKKSLKKETYTDYIHKITLT